MRSVCSPSKMQFFVQLCRCWQDFNWHSASRGLSAIAVLLVMAALHSRCGHYIFVVFLLPSFFFLFSSSNLSRRRLDVYHTSTHGVALVRIYNAGLKCAARGSLKIQDTKMTQKIAICGPSHNFIGLFLRNQGMYRQSEKPVKQQYLLHMFAQYGELRPTNGWDLLASLGHPS